MIGKKEINEAWLSWKSSQLFSLIGQQCEMADGSHEWHVGTVPTDRVRANIAGGKLVSTDFTSGLSWSAQTGYSGKVFKFDAGGYWENSSLYKSADAIKFGFFEAQKNLLP